MKRGVIEKDTDMNAVIRSGKGRTAISPPEKLSDTSQAMNAFIRGDAKKGEAMTPERAAELAAGGNYFINDDGSVRIKTAAGEVLYIEPDGSLKAPRKVPKGNAGEGTGTVRGGRKPKSFDEQLRDVIAERKRLGL